MAPPFTLMMLVSIPSSLITASACAEKASLNSMSLRSARVSPARASAFGTALMGPTPMMSGSTPATAKLTKRASGVRPSSFALAALITSTAAAPSEYGLALPAVTVPVGEKAGRSLASPSSVVSARGHSSVSNTTSVTAFSAPFHV